MSEYSNKPLTLVRINDDGVMAVMHQVKAYNNDPLPSDALVALTNDTLFNDAHVSFAQCALCITDQLHRTSVIHKYVGSYVLGTNS